MDTRKLIAHIDGESGDQGRIEQDGYGILCSMTGAGGIDILPEIVKRWNEYPQQAERIAKLEEELEAVLFVGEMIFMRRATPHQLMLELAEKYSKLLVMIDEYEAERKHDQTLKP